jgi:hypothetical protein
MRKALAVSGLKGVFVGEVKIEAEPLLEVRAVARKHASLLQKSVVSPGQIGRDGKNGLISLSVYLPVAGCYLVRLSYHKRFWLVKVNGTG